MTDRVAAGRRNMEIGAISTANRMTEYEQKAVKSNNYNGNLGLDNAKDIFMAIPQTYEQALDCQSLIDSFNGWEKQGQYDVAEAFSQMKNELGQKIQSGDLEEKIQIGGNAYTNEEWDKVLEKYDKAHMEIKSEIEEEIEERVEEQISNEQLVELLKDREFDPFGLSSRGNGNVPYSHLAKDGIIAYNGAVFVCDEEKNALLLGDCSDMKNCIRVSLEDGGSLIVNRDNLGELSSAISMFSPEDIRRILCAIADDKKIQSTQKEIDDAENALAEIA